MTYIDVVIVVEVGGAHTGVEFVAQLLQRPHARQQLPFLLNDNFSENKISN